MRHPHDHFLLPRAAPVAAPTQTTEVAALGTTTALPKIQMRPSRHRILLQAAPVNPAAAAAAAAPTRDFEVERTDGVVVADALGTAAVAKAEGQKGTMVEVGVEVEVQVEVQVQVKVEVEAEEGKAEAKVEAEDGEAEAKVEAEVEVEAALDPAPGSAPRKMLGDRPRKTITQRQRRRQL